MAQYTVLITLTTSRTIEAYSAEEARELALGAYMNGHIELDTMPIFECEECDKQEDDEE
jgi:hypothetical protein